MLMRIPARAEGPAHEIIGDTGAGKTQLIMQLLRQIKERGDSAIVYDPACEFVKRFYDPKRGDIILNPLDARCPYWGPAEELRRRAEAKAIAASLYQPTTGQEGRVLHRNAAENLRPSDDLSARRREELVEWMANPDEIDRGFKGTEMAHLIDQGRAAAAHRRSGFSRPGRRQPAAAAHAKDEAERHLDARPSGPRTGKGWIFLTSHPSEREALRPLQSLWIDLLVLRLLNEPTEGQKPVWFVIDELASLQRLPQLHTAITENRKSQNPVVLGFQGKAQLEYLYGHLAEVMLSQPATKILLTTTEPKAAEWVSSAIGKVEIERLRETHFDGTRHGQQLHLDRQVEPLVLDSEISGLADRHAYLKLGNHVACFSFAYIDIPAIAAGLRAAPA